METDENEVCLSGEKLIGDDYSPDQIREWHEDEKEGYAGLVEKAGKEHDYWYHTLNISHGYRHLPRNRTFERVIGLGSAFGKEFGPIAGRISELVIIEPSDTLMSAHIQGLKPVYSKPSIDGRIRYPDGYFDLAASFGTLHHIPNVTFVIGEIKRVLKPGGYFLLREPITSMGDWRLPRPGLTKRERGIPLQIFRKIIHDQKWRVISEICCFSMTNYLTRITESMTQRPLYSYKPYILFDKIISFLLRWNITYHRKSLFSTCAPGHVFYVLMESEPP
jgi:SAM-dependent methyltransferase